MDESEKKTESWTNKVQNLMQSKTVAAITLVVTALGQVIQKIVEIGKKFNSLMLEGLEYADQIGDLAAKYGTSSESISEMAYIATQAGADVETLTNAMSMLYMRAKQDGDAFKKLGVSVKDNNGQFKAMDELFWETVGAMNSLESDGEKSAYMLDLFGRSAANIGEILRKDTKEIAAMRREAHELGVVISTRTANIAGETFDKIDQLKLQWKSALASLAAGDPEAEEKMNKFFDNLLKISEKYIPMFVKFSTKLFIQILKALSKIAPDIVSEFVYALIEALASQNWGEILFNVGFQLGYRISQGIKEAILLFISNPTSIFKSKNNISDIQNTFDGIDTGSAYEISENLKQDINIRVEASGNTAVSKESAEKTAEALAPYIDKILGGK